MENSIAVRQNKNRSFALIFSAFIAGLCSIIYELLIATTVSYFLGDSIKYFSLTIGIYMASMGLGSFISKFIDNHILQRFIKAEILLGIMGGVSIPFLYFAYYNSALFIFTYLFFTITIGFLIGLEIPFLTRLMQKYCQLKVNIANILSFDYLGALIATISFPFILLPIFGIYQSSLLFGLINMSIAFSMLLVFRTETGKSNRSLWLFSILLSIFLILMIIFSNIALKHWDNRLYEDRIIYSKQSRYQKIILTKHRDDIRLFLDGNLQFSSIDEYRYHEALVHVPILLSNTNIKTVLLFGAGDGLAIRELLKYNSLEKIILVDLDKEVINLAKQNKYLTTINKESLHSNKVKIIIDDAFSFLLRNHEPFDLIISDLPDPNNSSLVRLYSSQFYKLVRKNLSSTGIFITQSTSPYFATKAFWSIDKTIRSVGFRHVLPYHVEIPSFGNWGFIVASNKVLNTSSNKPNVLVNTKFVDGNNYSKLLLFDKDLKINNDTLEINTLDKPVLLKYYLEGWKNYSY